MSPAATSPTSLPSASAPRRRRRAGGNAITPDGSVFVFRSADPSLNSLNGPQNGGTPQYYRYDDNDRSLVCVSCPADGSRAARRGARHTGRQAVEASSSAPTSAARRRGDSSPSPPRRRSSPPIRTPPGPARTRTSGTTSTSGATAACCSSPTASPPRRMRSPAKGPASGRRHPERPRHLLHRGRPAHPRRHRRL